MEGIIELHNNIIFYLCIILGLVSYIFFNVITVYNNSKIAYKYMNHGQFIEIV
ncbi:MAG: hypothetical protein DUD39_00880 [Coriobacteriaceae bacterium]|nr:MAG: hypothetical protein DUD39_00880 [Coriobacteriaceae bacterium]